MSRSDYTDDTEDYWRHIMWRGAVSSAIKGKRGQALLKEMLATLDAMPVKRLISEELQDEDGDNCAMGAVAKARGVKMEGIDPFDYAAVADVMGVSTALVREIAHENDEYRTDDERWVYMRAWVVEHIK